LPLEHVDETMRPQPVHAVAGAPSFVRGIALIRGVPVPVVDAAAALGEHASHVTRFVTLRTGDRRVAFAVDQVLGVSEIDRRAVSELPPLLARASVDVVSAIGTLDAELLMVLRSAKFVPETVWAAIEAGDTV
jgi:purine-binding chemotaxis protein CheW